ncbi:hypothetical protein GIW70_18255 [Pseudomonas syringae]|nr:hypothetical protein [Pseudomonas syringae]MCF5070133.1 hypothetical protein [Pseudomonas syringae]
MKSWLTKDGVFSPVKPTHSVIHWANALMYIVVRFKNNMLRSTKKATLFLLMSTALTAYGANLDKAEKVTDAGITNEHYNIVVDVARQDYSPRYPELSDEDIRKVVRDNISLDDLKGLVTHIYASRFNDDELDLIIRAYANPTQAETILVSSKEGRVMLDKVQEAQSMVGKDTLTALQAREDAITEALNKLKAKAHNPASH